MHEKLSVTLKLNSDHIFRVARVIVVQRPGRKRKLKLGEPYFYYIIFEEKNQVVSISYIYTFIFEINKWSKFRQFHGADCQTCVINMHVRCYIKNEWTEIYIMHGWCCWKGAVAPSTEK